jgi:hypothetical protein
MPGGDGKLKNDLLVAEKAGKYEKRPAVRPGRKARRLPLY